MSVPRMVREYAQQGRVSGLSDNMCVCGYLFVCAWIRHELHLQCIYESEMESYQFLTTAPVSNMGN